MQGAEVDRKGRFVGSALGGERFYISSMVCSCGMHSFACDLVRVAWRCIRFDIEVSEGVPSS